MIYKMIDFNAITYEVVVNQENYPLYVLMVYSKEDILESIMFPITDRNFDLAVKRLEFKLELSEKEKLNEQAINKIQK